MGEEIRNRHSELNEAELTGVSGGFDLSGAIRYADGVCRHCPLHENKACAQKSHLARYLLSQYPNMIYKYTECPYYK